MKRINIKRAYCKSSPNNKTPLMKLDSNDNCALCGERFSFWDQLNIHPLDEELECAKCKGIDLVITDDPKIAMEINSQSDQYLKTHYYKNDKLNQGNAKN